MLKYYLDNEEVTKEEYEMNKLPNEIKWTDILGKKVREVYSNEYFLLPIKEILIENSKITGYIIEGCV